MKSRILVFMAVLVVFAVAALAFDKGGANSVAVNKGAALRNEDPWRPDQLLAPEDLAKVIGDPAAKQPFIFCVGPGAVIKGSIDVGPARDSGNLVKLRQQLAKLPKDAWVVIYCGCCPFVHCPNIRPAFALLNEMKFTHPRLLNLEHNIKVDWIGKGYPVTK